MFRSYYIGNPLVSTVSISSASSARAGGGGNVLVSERKSQQESVGEEIIHYHRGMDGVCIHPLCQTKGGDERGYDTVMCLNGSPEIFNPAPNVQILFLRKAILGFAVLNLT